MKAIAAMPMRSFQADTCFASAIGLGMISGRCAGSAAGEELRPPGIRPELDAAPAAGTPPGSAAGIATVGRPAGPTAGAAAGVAIDGRAEGDALGRDVAPAGLLATAPVTGLESTSASGAGADVAASLVLGAGTVVAGTVVAGTGSVLGGVVGGTTSLVGGTGSVLGGVLGGVLEAGVVSTTDDGGAAWVTPGIDSAARGATRTNRPATTGRRTRRTRR